MKKIIHLSDLHIGYKDFKDRFITLIEYLNSQVTCKPSRYVVVITGDIINNANKKGGYEEALEGIDLLKEYGFKDVLVIPGNHDYGSGNKGSKKFVQLFKTAFFKAQIDYPKLDIISNVAFIGLDSMAQELEWYNELFAQGQLGNLQLAKLESILHQENVKACAKRVIYLHHHPFKWRPLHELKDTRKLKKILTTCMNNGISIDALLFGHNHEGNPHNGKWNVPRCYDAGTATSKPRSKYLSWAKWFTVQASIRIIDLNKDPDKDILLPAIFTE